MAQYHAIPHLEVPKNVHPLRVLYSSINCGHPHACMSIKQNTAAPEWIHRNHLQELLPAGKSQLESIMHEKDMKKLHSSNECKIGTWLSFSPASGMPGKYAMHA